MELWAIEWLIKNRLVEGQPKVETSRVWTSILTHHFKVTDGYTTGLEMLHGSSSAELFTSHLVFKYEHDKGGDVAFETRRMAPDQQRNSWFIKSPRAISQGGAMTDSSEDQQDAVDMALIGDGCGPVL